MPIEEIHISVKSKYSIDEILTALKAIYCNKDYNEKIFSISENSINAGKIKTGRPGMDLWCIFVLSQVSLCLIMGYEGLHNLANNHRSMRHLMGVEKGFGYEPVLFEYQNIYDNVSMLSDELVAEINKIVLVFGHG